jgi:hypothetical protein
LLVGAYNLENGIQDEIELQGSYVYEGKFTKPVRQDLYDEVTHDWWTAVFAFIEKRQDADDKVFAIETSGYQRFFAWFLWLAPAAIFAFELNQAMRITEGKNQPQAVLAVTLAMSIFWGIPILRGYSTMFNSFLAFAALAN